MPLHDSPPVRAGVEGGVLRLRPDGRGIEQDLRKCEKKKKLDQDIYTYVRKFLFFGFSLVFHFFLGDVYVYE